jgi:hypothetical protein
VDGTGLKLCGAGEWLVEKPCTKTRQPWRKLHIGMNAEPGQIVAATLAVNDVDDRSQVGPLLDQVEGPWPRSPATARMIRTTSTAVLD